MPNDGSRRVFGGGDWAERRGGEILTEQQPHQSSFDFGIAGAGVSLPQSGQQADSSQATRIVNQRELLRRRQATQDLDLYLKRLRRGVLNRVARHAAIILAIPL
jgi:hypothetical protein